MAGPRGQAVRLRRAEAEHLEFPANKKFVFSDLTKSGVFLHTGTMFADARRFVELRMTMLGDCPHKDDDSGYTGTFTVDVSALSRRPLQRREPGAVRAAPRPHTPFLCDGGCVSAGPPLPTPAPPA